MSVAAPSPRNGEVDLLVVDGAGKRHGTRAVIGGAGQPPVPLMRHERDQKAIRLRNRSGGMEVPVVAGAGSGLRSKDPC